MRFSWNPRIMIPVVRVSMAAKRNHHSARGTSFSMASVRDAASNSANEGTCTKLK